MNFWLDVYNAAMEGEYRAEQADARADYDAACARRQRLIDQAETLCDALDDAYDTAGWARDFGRAYRIYCVANAAFARLERRVAADVEF